MRTEVHLSISNNDRLASNLCMLTDIDASFGEGAELLHRVGLGPCSSSKSRHSATNALRLLLLYVCSPIVAIIDVY